MNQLSDDRVAALASAYASGMSLRKAATVCGVNRETVLRYYREFEGAPATTPQAQSAPQPPIRKQGNGAMRSRVGYVLCLYTDDAFRVRRGIAVREIYIGGRSYPVEPARNLGAGCWKPDVSSGSPQFHETDSAKRVF